MSKTIKDTIQKYIGNALFVLVVFIVVVLVAAMVYALWHFIVVPLWQPLLFYSYVIMGILLIVIGISYFRKNLQKNMATPGTEIPQTIRSQKKYSSTTQTILEPFSIFLWSISSIISWPAMFFLGIAQSKKESVYSINLLSKTRLIQLNADPFLSGVTLVMSLCVLLINSIFPLQWSYARTFSSLMLIHVLIRHMSYILSPKTLPQKLRLSFSAPIIAIILIALFDLITLTLSLYQITLPYDRPTLVMLSEISWNILNKSLRNIVSEGNLNFENILMSSAGILFYFAFISSFSQWPAKLKRTDDDYRKEAKDHLDDDEFIRALESIEKVKEKENRDNLIKISSFIGLNQIEKAFSTAKNYLSVKQELISDDEIISLVVDQVKKINSPQEVIALIIEKTFNSDVTDTGLLFILEELKVTNKMPLSKLVKIFEDERLKNIYPLSYSFIQIQDIHFQVALESLQLLEPKSDIERIQHSYLQLNAKLISCDSFDEKSNCFLEWTKKNLPLISNNITKLTNDWQRIVAYRMILEIGLLTRIYAPYREQECVYIMNSIKITVTKESDTEKKITEYEKWFLNRSEIQAQALSRIKAMKPEETKQALTYYLLREERKVFLQSPFSSSTLLGKITEEAQKYFNIGNEEYEKGNYQAAKDAFKLCTKFDDSNRSESWFNLALTFYNLGESESTMDNYYSAIDNYYIALSKDRENPIIHNNLGDAYYRLMKFSRAIPEYDYAIELDSKYLKAWYNRGLAYACIADYKSAIRDFTEVVSLEDGKLFAEAWHVRGLAYHYDEQYPRAISDFNRAIELNSNFDEAYMHRANSKYMVGDKEGAISDFNSALNIRKDNPDIHFNIGLMNYTEGNYENAISSFMKAIEMKYIDFGEAYYQLGWSYYRFNDYKKAIEYFNKAQGDGDIDDYEINYSLGLAHNALSQFEIALDKFNEAVKSNVETPPPEYFYYRGYTKQNLSDFVGAVEDFTKAIELGYSEPSEVYADRGLVKMLLRKYEEAIFDFNKAIELDNNNNFALSSRAILYAYLGAEDKALGDIKAVEERQTTGHEYNVACTYSVLYLKTSNSGYKGKAFEKLRFSLVNNIVTSDHVYNDPDWQHFHDDTEFLFIIGKKIE